MSSDSYNASLDTITTGVSLTATELIRKEGTIPFCGLHEASSYPDAVTPDTERYVSPEEDSERTFSDAIQVLPEATKVDIFANNIFAYETEDGTTVDENAMTTVDGVDTEIIEKIEGKSLNDLAEQFGEKSVLEIPNRKAIIDPRRLLLRNLGIPSIKNAGRIKFFWQIASDRYSPLEVRRFLQKKAEVCSEHETDNAFGWIRHRDWGGSVTLTTIYPSKSYVIDPTEQSDDDTDNSADDKPDRKKNLDNVAGDPEADSETTDKITVYYGDRMRYHSKGTKKVDVTPVIYFPKQGVMTPVSAKGETLSRKHTGSLMDDVMGYHEDVLEKITELSTEINKDIKQARQYAIDFSNYDLNIEQFYEYLGIENESYVEAAADRARRFSNTPSKPTIWNLHLSLKTALLNNYTHSLAGDTYQSYQEIAGQLLQQPALKLSIALSEHKRQQRKDNEESPADQRDENQISITESLSEILEHDAVTESDLSLSESEALQEQVNEQIETIGGDSE